MFPCWWPIEYFSQRLYVYTLNFVQNDTATCRRVGLTMSQPCVHQRSEACSMCDVLVFAQPYLKRFGSTFFQPLTFVAFQLMFVTLRIPSPCWTKASLKMKAPGNDLTLGGEQSCLLTPVYCLNNVFLVQSFRFPFHVKAASCHFCFSFQNHFEYLSLIQLTALRVCDVCKISNHL